MTLRRSSSVLLCFFLSTAAVAAVPEYEALRGARPDGRTISVNHLTLTRDAYRLTFRNGTFHLLAPAANVTWGAVFVGDGSFNLIPNNPAERNHLELVTGERNIETLSDTFDSMVLFFTDDTVKQLEGHAAVTTASPDQRATQLYTEHLNRQKTKYQINLHLRILQDLLNGRAGEGVFIASVDSAKFAPALLVFDPLGIGNLAARFGDLGGEETGYLSFDEQNGGFWYLSTKGQSVGPPAGKPHSSIADAEHYAIVTTIKGNTEIDARTTVRLKTLRPGVRVVPLHIMPKLRISQASVSVGGASTPVEVIQEEVELGRIARLFKDEVADADAAIVVAQPLAPNETVEMTIAYAGRDVLQSVGADSYSVRARESWYPNLGTFNDLATYELTFRFPKRNNIISVGRQVSETEEPNQKVAVWKAEKPMRIAGFNYGRFQKLSKKDDTTGIVFDVYTSRDRARFAQNTMADAMNTARIGGIFFGDAPFSPVSVSQQVEWFFGQSWPSLIYLPELALTSSTERVAMFEEQVGPQMFQLNEFAKTVGWHEFAHQWWGHQIGFQTYRDQWISEGFSEFTSALVLEFTENPRRYVDFWKRKRDEILSRRGAVSNAEAGPISQGFRLATRRSPEAAQANIYSKGGYVLHMLRSLMREPTSKNPDEKFIAMMRDFVAKYSGKNPSTADFQRVVEAHISPRLDAAGNGKMDWFFNQWVHGTEIPKFKNTLKIEPAAAGMYKISGAVSQEGVSEDFISVVPIYFDFGGDKLGRLGTVKLIGSAPAPLETEMKIAQKPRRMLVNPVGDVLARE